MTDPTTQPEYSFKIDSRARAERWLLHAGGWDITPLREVFTSRFDGISFVRFIYESAVTGSIRYHDDCILALAIAMISPHADVRIQAAKAVPIVCMRGKDILYFAKCIKKYRGFGKLVREAINTWYFTRGNPAILAYEVISYPAAYGWTHRDLLRQTHILPTPEYNEVLKWIAHPEKGSGNFLPNL